MTKELLLRAIYFPTEMERMRSYSLSIADAKRKRAATRGEVESAASFGGIGRKDAIESVGGSNRRNEFRLSPLLFFRGST